MRIRTLAANPHSLTFLPGHETSHLLRLTTRDEAQDISDPVGRHHHHHAQPTVESTGHLITAHTCLEALVLAGHQEVNRGHDAKHTLCTNHLSL